MDQSRANEFTNIWMFCGHLTRNPILTVINFLIEYISGCPILRVAAILRVIVLER